MARTKKLDFTGVESYTKASEGIHTAKVAEIEEKTSQGGDDMLQFAFEITKGEDKGCKVFESFVLTDKALWKLKSFLQAIGMKADGKIKLDLDKLIGKVCNIEVFWDDYNGQTRAKISDYYKAGKGGGTSAGNDDDDEYDGDEAEDEDEDEPAPAKPSKGKKASKAPAKGKGKKKPEPEDDEDEDEDDEDEEDEEPAPKKRKASKAPAKGKGKAAKGKKKPEPEPEDDEDDEDDDEWEEDED